MGVIGRTALLAMAVSTLLGASGEDARASALDDAVGDGPFVTAQEGDQNFDCGNTHDLINVNVLRTTRQETCSDYGDTGFTDNGTTAVGGTALGSQFTTAQSGEQNLHCGNSADMLTLNVLGTIDKRTTCTAVDRSGELTSHNGSHQGEATAESGTAVGPQSATAQTGRQNLRCGADEDLVAVPVLGETRKSAVCAAVKG